MVFDEKNMPYLSQNEEINKKDSKRSDQPSVEVEHDVSSCSGPEPKIKEERNDNDVQSDRPVSEENDLDGYLLARDRERRVIQPPARYNQVDLIFYTLNVAEEID